MGGDRRAELGSARSAGSAASTRRRTTGQQRRAVPYNTPTWTFYRSTYTSSYLAFTPVEEYTNIPDPSTGGYTTLMNLTREQQALISKYDAASQGAIPFIDYGNKFTSAGASYDPGLLQQPDLGADRRRPARSVKSCRESGARHGQLRDHRAVRADREQARLRVHRDRPLAAGQDLTGVM